MLREVDQSGYTKDFVASVQRDLARCSFYSGPATGITDGKTKDAIKNFKSTMGLPVNDTLDASVVDALNQIVHKPSVSVNTNLKYATRFLQWWIGSPKNGVYDNDMKERVRQWQIKAGIWSAAGADGVIREKDWGKILREVDQSGYTKDFVASVQRDLARCSFYSGPATGITDGKTKDAIKNFKSTMGLPVNDTLDASVVDALNQIVHKPSVSVNTNLKYATRFLQWWIGSPKNGVYDNDMKERVRQWQIKAGIWSAAGADGVIREKDWNKILK
ncbi:peptidoglycan-binding protein [Clostridium sp. Marseille-Q2269]|uniref:peptidoglycan-binding domain-containing protein n=1 Tax=Clostridium sp. Marseille-Q2269 TaxID=2942205 RepID=UPI0020733F90|nr:peptidoglycan-binding protein [Clostridium sp. Marseille-Q2269]